MQRKDGMGAEREGSAHGMGREVAGDEGNHGVLGLSVGNGDGAL